MKIKFTSQVLIASILLHASTSAQPVIKGDKAIGGSGPDILLSMCSTKDGGLIAGGKSWSNQSYEKTQNSRGGADYWVVKMDKRGKIQWDETIGSSGDDNYKSVIQTLDGGYALIGESFSNISGEKSENSRGGTDYWMVKLDSMGNFSVG